MLLCISEVLQFTFKTTKNVSAKKRFPLMFWQEIFHLNRIPCFFFLFNLFLTITYITTTIIITTSPITYHLLIVVSRLYMKMQYAVIINYWLLSYYFHWEKNNQFVTLKCVSERRDCTAMFIKYEMTELGMKERYCLNSIENCWITK